MSEQPSRAPVRFCPGCGEAAPGGANFCVSCGASLRTGRGRAAESTAPGLRSQLPGLAVLATFLAIGLGLWVVVLRPPAEPGRLPLAPKSPAPPTAGTGSSQASLPSDHPPIEIPAEVRTFVAELERKANESPRDVEAWKNLAQVQYRAGQVDRQYLAKAEAAFRRVLEIDPKNTDALRGIGNVHFDREEHGKAVESYSEYLKLKPGDANVRTDLGTMYLYSGQAGAAVREYENVIESDPRFYQAYFNLAIARVRLGESALALEAFEKAKSLAPDEETRKQIQAMIDRASSGGASPAAEGGLHERIERSLRTHPIAGPKVVRFEWSSPTEGRVVFNEFPMEAMPEFVRTKFLDRVKSDLAEARRAGGAEGPARLELVDRDSGKIMATVTVD